MKGLALETVVKWIILLVVAGVVINLMFFFSDKIVLFIRSFMQPEEPFEAEMVETASFSTSQVMTYMRSCWDRTGEKFEEDVICYILKGDMSGVDKNSLLAAIDRPEVSIDTTKFDTTKNMAVIKFEDVGNKIILES